jgi:LmbE family N-acetylglucosaminyl deacetylase
MKRLVISPHVDDEVLGCSSVLNAETVVHYVGVTRFQVVSRKERLREATATAKYFGFKFSSWLDTVVNQYDVFSLISPLEALINDQQPSEVFIPYRDSYNQDHRAVFQAALVALRPHDKNWFVKKVLMYEQPDMLWTPETFRANYFVPLDFKKKMKGLRIQASQMRGHRSEELIHAMAKIRGEQAGIPTAEGFEVLRFVAG